MTTTTRYERLATIGHRVMAAIEKDGRDTVLMFASWRLGAQKPGPVDEKPCAVCRLMTPYCRCSPDEKAPTVDRRDRDADRRTAGYAAEYGSLLARLERDLLRVEELHAVAKRPDAPKPAPHNQQGCELCSAAGLKRDGKPIPFEHTSNVGDRLNRDMRLCDGHYWVIYRQAVTGKMGKGWTPSPAQTRHWWTTGTWKLKAAS